MTSSRSPYLESHLEALSSLENFLGGAYQESSPFSFSRIVEIDETEDFPEESIDLLNQWGLNKYYIPAALGGELATLDVPMDLARLVARRDITLAIGHGITFLGAIPVWLSGSPEQKEALVNYILDGKAISFVLTEREHGSDILANEVTAKAIDGQGYVLDGEKWIINNATRNSAMTLMAKTGSKLQATDYSMFFVQKSKITGHYKPLPKIKTFGVRSADISGISFQQAPLTNEDRLSKEGSGFAIAIKTVQITKNLTGALSLGAADTALRASIAYARNRVLYGEACIEIPYVRTVLLQAFVDILISDCLLRSVTRAFHVIPAQMSLYAAVVKYAIPRRLEDTVKELARFLGSRSFLREYLWSGIFQKILRDMALIPIFDSNEVINAKYISQQIPLSIKRRRDTPEEEVKKIFDLSVPLDPFEFSTLKINNLGKDSFFGSLHLIRDFVNSEKRIALPDPYRTDMRAKVQSLFDLYDQFEKDVAILEMDNTLLSMAENEIAGRYTLFTSAIACIQIYLNNQSLLSENWGDSPDWLLACLDTILADLAPTREVQPQKYYEQTLFNQMLSLVDNSKLCSMIPIEIL